MARAPVVQVQCDRCKRVDLLTQDKVRPAGSEPILVLKFGGKELKYDDLCETCHKAVTRLVVEIQEWEREIKQEFLGARVPPNAAPPLVAPPNFSPAKPHAPSNSK